MKNQKQMPKIEKVMTSMPKSIGKDQPIDTAIEFMRELRIRHLPVQEGGHLVGVLTDRDVKLASSLYHSNEFTVEDVMTPDPYAVRPEASLDEVVFEMAEHKYGCAVVQQENQKVVGIFTATDGLRVLGELLNEHYRKATE